MIGEYLIRFTLKCLQSIFFLFDCLIPVQGVEMRSFIFDDSYSRKKYAKNVSRAVNKSACYSAGKIVRFSTDGEMISVSVKYKKRAILSNMDGNATSSLDVYSVGNIYNYLGSICPNNRIKMRATATFELKTANKSITNEIAIFLPGFAEIGELKINVKGNIYKSQKKRKRISIYGSSISQGCSASRVSFSYGSIVAITNDADLINMGFSEGAKGESDIIREFSNCKADYYIIEYDHNADIERLKTTHRKVYECVRANNPDSVIILISRISGGVSITQEESKVRQKIIQKTLEYGISKGDKNLYLIDGYVLTDEGNKKYLKDDRHPNDLGMQYIANKINEIIMYGR